MDNSIKINAWRKKPTEDQTLISTFKKNKDNKKLHCYFDKQLSFKANGIVTKLGIGTNLLNEFTIAAAASAFAQWLISNRRAIKKDGVVIAMDNRINGDLFLKVTTKVLKFWGIKVYVFKDSFIQPDPLLAFAIQKIHAGAGIYIGDANHGKLYNGFKIYDSWNKNFTKSQLNEITNIMQGLDPLDVSYSKFKPSYINKNIHLAYIQQILGLVKRPNDQKLLKVSYSSLNGSGSDMVPTIFQKMDIGYKTIDSNLKGLKYCDLQDYKTYRKITKHGHIYKSDLVIVTDHDVNGIGVCFRDKLGTWKKLNGNEIASIVFQHILRTHPEEKGVVIQTLVSSNRIKLMAKMHGWKVIETNVGFKNITENLVDRKDSLIIAWEECNNFLLNHQITTRPDALQTMICLIEAVNYLKTQQIPLYRELSFLNTKYDHHIYYNVSKKIPAEILDKIFLNLSSIKVGENISFKFNIKSNNKIAEVIKKKNFIKITLENRTWFAIFKNEEEQYTQLYFEAVGNYIKESKYNMKEIKNIFKKVISISKKINKQQIIFNKKF